MIPGPWPFIIAAYAIGVGGTVAMTVWSWWAMRRAEAEAERLSRRAEPVT